MWGTPKCDAQSNDLGKVLALPPNCGCSGGKESEALRQFAIAVCHCKQHLGLSFFRHLSKRLNPHGAGKELSER